MRTGQSVFDRSGLATRHDFKTQEWAETFRKLEADHAEFLALEDQFRSKGYLWGADPLHQWSRAWEYPYVYHHVARMTAEQSRVSTIVDVGSGVTFFPFSLARLGHRVICVDNDPICASDLPRAAQLVRSSPGEVVFRPSNGAALPVEDGEAQCVYCISVLEHVPEFEGLVREIARALAPGGMLLLTVDVDLLGNLEIGPARFRDLQVLLNDLFVPLHPETTVHPLDVLRSDQSMFPFPQGTALRNAARSAMNVALRQLGRPERGVLLACHAMALTKR